MGAQDIHVLAPAVIRPGVCLGTYFRIGREKKRRREEDLNRHPLARTRESEAKTGDIAAPFRPFSRAGHIPVYSTRCLHPIFLAKFFARSNPGHVQYQTSLNCLFLFARGKSLALECRTDVEGRFRFESFDDKLADLSLVRNHSQMERTEGYHLKSDLAVESGMDGGCGEMDDDPNTGKRAAT